MMVGPSGLRSHEKPRLSCDDSRAGAASQSKKANKG